MKEKILGVVTRIEAERLLEDWANLPDLPGFWPGIDRFAGHLSAAAILADRARPAHPALPPGACPEYERLLAKHATAFPGITLQRGNHFQLQVFRNRLRQAWDARDQYSRDWYISKFCEDFHKFIVLEELAKEAMNAPTGSLDFHAQELYTSRGGEPPPLTPFEATMFYFRTTLANKAKHCGNATCPAPYFIAKKKGQQHCGEKCAASATREAKRRWAADYRARKRGIQ
jgi:hypothetical protein